MSDQSRRKLLKSIAAGSGAIVAGKSLPESWSRPVVDSVMLPAHALTSACRTIVIFFDVTVNGDLGGNVGYNIYRVGSNTPIDGDGDTLENGTVINDAAGHAYGPGQYLVSAGFAANTGGGSVTGEIGVACCTDDFVIIVDETITATSVVRGCALVTLGEDGTCMVELSSDCPT